MNNEGGVGSAAAGADTFSTVSMISFSLDRVGGRPAELPLGEQEFEPADEEQQLLLLSVAGL